MSAQLRRASPNFNSRPSARGDLFLFQHFPNLALFQFTPLREGRRYNGKVDMKIILISIHAPPRGATLLPEQESGLKVISIHAPPRGATTRWRNSSRSFRFQFTPLREGRQLYIVASITLNLISIHAPPRGATKSRGCGQTSRRYFNSRPSARGDV